VNIFFLDRRPDTAAEMHCDKHCVKMILEYAQLLSSAHRVLDGDDAHPDLYKIAHKNHPSTIWTRSSVHNYMWLYVHMTALMNEYTYRYGKHHATERLLEPLSKPPSSIPMVDFIAPPQCMPDYCKGDDTVLAYQKYYIIEKSKIATWNKTRSAPKWWKDNIDGSKRGLLRLHDQKIA